ncbi:MAG: TraB/GumN family protein, partial [Bdellovibrionales bacterium]|nr:TraB/GumN family protein [Bdellovibrionales bacterium]
AQLLLAGFQKKLGNKLDIKPGAEMMRALSVASELNKATIMADREVKTTLKRTWASLGAFSLIKLVGAMIGSLFVKNDITEEEIERLKSSDALEEMMKELSDAIPGVKTALIDERDRYLAAKIQSSPGNKIVAIVGAGHVPGIKNHIGSEIDLASLEIIPPSSPVSKIIAWTIPLVIIGMIVYGFFTAGSSSSIDMIQAWVLANSIPAGIGALLALARPLTIVAAMIAAPITSLNPFIAAGWVAGLVEAMISKPRVSDFETIGDDVGSISGIWRNRLSRILLVIALTNLGSVIGTLIGIPMVASLL